jgi:hypothetical protein
MVDRTVVERMTIVRADKGDNPEEHLEVTFSEPWLMPSGEWRCAVVLPFRRKKPYEICGVDAAQANQLALRFANDLMAHHGWRRI